MAISALRQQPQDALTRFETTFKVENSKPEDLKAKVKQWALTRLPSKLRQDGKAESALAQTSSWNREGWKIESADITEDSSGKSRNLFALRLERPDDTHPTLRKWITEVSVVSKQGEDPQFSLTLFVQDVPGRNLLPPAISTPAIVSEIIDQHRSRSSHLPVSDRPIRIDHEHVSKFADALTSSQRRLPIIYVSRTSRNELLVDVNKLATQYRGRAIVAFEDEPAPNVDMSLIDSLKLYLPKELLAYGGAIRVYSPDVRALEPIDHLRHRFIDPGTASRLGDRGVLSRISHIIDRQRTESPSAQSGSTITEIFSILSARQLADLEKKLKLISERQKAQIGKSLLEAPRQNLTVKRPPQKPDLPPVSTPIPPTAPASKESLEFSASSTQIATQTEVVALQKQIANLEEEKRLLTDRLNSSETEVGLARQKIRILEGEMQNLRDQIQKASAKVQNEAEGWQEIAEDLETKLVEARAEIAMLQAKIKSTESPDVGDLIDTLGANHSQRIVIHGAAKKGAIRDFRGKKELISVIQRIVDAVATNLYELHFGDSPSKKKTEDFKRLSGFDLAEKESDTTMNDRRLKGLRTVSLDGKSYVGEAHIKHGNSPGNQVRLHYAVDYEKKRIVITHIVDHLELKSTN